MSLFIYVESIDPESLVLNKHNEIFSPRIDPKGTTKSDYIHDDNADPNYAHINFSV